MSKIIYKQNFNLGNLQPDSGITYPLPVGARIVNFGWFGTSDDTLSIWYEFDSPSYPVPEDLPREDRTIFVFGTGDEIPPDLIYRGTAFVVPFVWHLYEAKIPGKPQTDET